jgi:hypothetical protein
VLITVVYIENRPLKGAGGTYKRKQLILEGRKDKVQGRVCGVRTFRNLISHDFQIHVC